MIPAGPDVESRTIEHRLANAERNRDAVGNQRDPQAERDRNRHFFQDQIPNGNRAEIAFAEIEASVIPDQFEKRSCAGLSKPNCFSSLAMNSGSSPCAPRYLDESASARGLGSARNRSLSRNHRRRRKYARLPSPPCPVSCAITCSTGPPGANWMTVKDSNMIPRIVGIISKRRRAI